MFHLADLPYWTVHTGSEIYADFDEQSESEVKNIEILHPDLEIDENRCKVLRGRIPLLPLNPLTAAPL